jgi:hypothetical protein
VADDDDAAVGLEQLGADRQVVLGGDVQAVAGALGPVDKVALVAGPAGRGILLAVAVGVGPFHVGIARGRPRRWRLAQRNTRCPFGQGDEAAAPRPLGAEDGREAVAPGSGDAIVVVRSAPIIVGAPGAGGGQQQHIRRPLRRAADEEDMVVLGPRPGGVPAAGDHHIATRRAVARQLQAKGNGPTAADHRAVFGRIRPVSFEVLGTVKPVGVDAISPDVDVVAGGGGGDVEADIGARRVGEGVTVAPDLQGLWVGIHALVEILADARGPGAGEGAVTKAAAHGGRSFFDG